MVSFTSNSTGTGLGLPISRSFARMMGGDLQVKSELGKGSEFYMTLYFPLGKEEEKIRM
ncbi:MAG: ATP-binding protein [Blautia marasmi]